MSALLRRRSIVVRSFDGVPFSANLRAFYRLYVFFVSPYFYHDAFMHHTMHVGLLDAPGTLLQCITL